MKFRDRRRRFFDNSFSGVVLQMVLHLTVSLAGIGALAWSMKDITWIPLIVFGVLTLVLEGLWRFDRLFGWPAKKI